MIDEIDDDYPEEEDQTPLKILIIGNSGTGKSSILTRFTEQNFRSFIPSTCGIDFKKKTLNIDGNSIQIQIWDTAGQEKYKSITQTFYKNAQGLVIVFDLTDRISFEELTNWLKFSRLHAGEEVCKILLGNKCDSNTERQVTQQEIDEFLSIEPMKYMESSAKNNINIEEAFIQITKDILKKFYKDRINLNDQELKKTRIAKSPSRKLSNYNKSVLERSQMKMSKSGDPKKKCSC